MTVSAAEGSLVIDLAVDTSAVMAVLLREPGAEAVLERLCQAVQPAVASPTRTEILLVALVKLGEVGQERAREFLDCFSYALAKRLQVPLLFVGNDLSRTDLEAALG